MDRINNVWFSLNALKQIEKDTGYRIVGNNGIMNDDWDDYGGLRIIDMNKFKRNKNEISFHISATQREDISNMIPSIKELYEKKTYTHTELFQYAYSCKIEQLAGFTNMFFNEFFNEFYGKIDDPSVLKQFGNFLILDIKIKFPDKYDIYYVDNNGEFCYNEGNVYTKNKNIKVRDNTTGYDYYTIVSELFDKNKDEGNMNVIIHKVEKS